ncbi:26253_t:CDS:2 [Gigaspora margarita]|uniref:26253_t:CDS:1 n=1 Tax=Gigaspora margarita TaxID=4874 RepID=A0ABM8VVK1_GIGMA|nr:26253_t:CDS:2 [Gigaspora margarita]
MYPSMAKGIGGYLHSHGYDKNSRTLVICIAILQGLLFSLDGFVTALLKSPFNQMCYAINKSEGIPYKKKRLIITLATRSNEHCKETLKKMGMLTIVTEMIRIFIMGRGIIDKDLEPYELKKIEKSQVDGHAKNKPLAKHPTGELHIGGARTALFCYLWAKRNQGLKPNESIFQTGKHGSYRQTQRLDIYRRHIEKLLAAKKAYYCFCSPEELAQEREKFNQENKRSNYQYSRKCLQLNEKEIQSFLHQKKPYVARLKIPSAKNYSFADLVRGEVNFRSQDIEDFVLFRQNGIPNYNFACVVDDHLMKISHVLRGEEHLSNTGKQLALYETLG